MQTLRDALDAYRFPLAWAGFVVGVIIVVALLVSDRRRR
jgi:hypothetical protein